VATGLVAVFVSKLPSPSRSHSYLTIVPSVSVEDDPLNVTVVLVRVGFDAIVKLATGALFVPPGSTVIPSGVPGWAPMSERRL
jgi:hypothetical protein